MNDLEGMEGQLRGTIEIKRAATGKVERYDFVGHLGGSEDSTNETILEEHNDGSNTQRCGA
jgi:hypothetical protein